MKFVDSFRAFVVASFFAMSLLHLIVLGSGNKSDPNPFDPNHTCVYACNPRGQHGCRDNCPICDPVQRRCVPEGGSHTPAPPTSAPSAPPPPPPPPTSAPPPPPPPPPPPTKAPPPPPPPPTSAPSGKCMAVVVTKEEEHGVYVREKPTTKSAWQQDLEDDETIELTEMVTGEEYRGTNKWFKYGNGYVTGASLEFQNGGPWWCTVNGG